MIHENKRKVLNKLELPAGIFEVLHGKVERIPDAICSQVEDFKLYGQVQFSQSCYESLIEVVIIHLYQPLAYFLVQCELLTSLMSNWGGKHQPQTYFPEQPI